uniref:phenylalanine--tRNA ligase n=1 Tax=Plumaria plumosa TaxID=189642 RepID=A0A4D6WXA6_9FLOR|nr:Phenylalanine-tRNA ligase beta subunit [Plumaria plumosa]
MKFSWKSLNDLIDLKNISLNKFTNNLILAGFEIDKIDTYNNDCIIDISITSNRIDTLYLIGIAREISCIFNTTLRIYKTNDYKYNRIKSIENTTDTELLTSFKIHHRINSLDTLKSPHFLNDFLRRSNLKSGNLLYAIQQYIKLKWGQTIFFFNLNELMDNYHFINYSAIYIKTNETNLIATLRYKNQIIYDLSNSNSNLIDNINCKTETQSILLYSSLYQAKHIIRNSIDDLLNAYNETIQLIVSYSKVTIGKLYTYSRNRLNLINLLNISTNEINKILGPTSEQSQKVDKLSKKQIYILLQQINLQPKYDYSKKLFKINIPLYRSHDLYRNIDIIEEIGRIHGFHKFIDSLPKKTKKGKISRHAYYIKEIRQILRNIGLNEVLNSSFIPYYTEDNNILQIYNPMTEEQSLLRSNLISNLIESYKHNVNQKNTPIELFEIGKIFYINNHNCVQEQMHLAGILSNNNFIRKTWSDKTEKINWFHSKGILENFLEQIQAKLRWHKIIQDNIDKQWFNIIQISYLNKTIGLYDNKTNELIGIFSELNKKNINKNDSIYIFEINIHKLIANIINTKHLDYIMKDYSSYPSVIRDISIKTTKDNEIENLKKNIFNMNYYKECIYDTAPCRGSPARC